MTYEEEMFLTKIGNLERDRAELIEALLELHAIDERKLAATARRPYAIGISTIRERVERNRALLSRLEKDRT